AEQAVRDGAKLIILSDCGVSAEQVGIPMLLTVGAVHQQLVRAGLRLQTDLVAQTGEAREVHQIATLLGFGANAVYPTLALATIAGLAAAGKTSKPVEPAKALLNYRDAIDAGLYK